MTNEFPGYLKTFDWKKDEEIEDTSVLVEVVSIKRDGTVELRFRDRNEDCYLELKLQDLITGACLVGVTDDE